MRGKVSVAKGTVEGKEVAVGDTFWTALHLDPLVGHTCRSCDGIGAANFGVGSCHDHRYHHDPDCRC